jgi:hypothetical protein
MQVYTAGDGELIPVAVDAHEGIWYAQHRGGAADAANLPKFNNRLADAIGEAKVIGVDDEGLGHGETAGG